MDVDSALSTVGGYRRWHIFVFGMLSVSSLIAVNWHSLISVFVGWEPMHYCNGYNQGFNSNILYNIWNHNESHDTESLNDTFSRFSHKIENMNSNLSRNYFKCNEYYTEMIDSLIDNTSLTLRKLVPCESDWVYESHGYLTIVEEWNLVCDKNFFVELTHVLYVLGALLGEIGLSFLIDKYGRKRMHIISHAIICIFGIINSLSVSYLMFALIRILLGMFSAINMASGTLAAFELFDSNHRTIPGIFSQFGMVFCYITLPLLAYFLPHWRHLQFTVSLVCGCFVFFGCILPESVPWLFQKGRVKEAEEILRKMARYNGVTLNPGIKLLSSSNISVEKQTTNSYINSPIPEIVVNNETPKESNVDPEFTMVIMKPPHLQINEDNARQDIISTKLSLKDVLNDKIMLKFLVILGMLWFTVYLTLHSILLSASNLGRNRFINYLAVCSFDIPAILLTSHLCNKFGRRLMIFGSFTIGGIFSIASSLLPLQINYIDTFWINMIFTMIAKICYGSVFGVMLLYTKELFPTQLRSTCGGICQVWGRFGNILSPLSAYLLKTQFYWLPYMINGCLALCAGMLVLLLPETKGRVAPETIEHCHKLDKSTRFFKRCK